MNIVFLQDDFPPHSLGGAGNIAFSLARGLASYGHTVSIITATQDKRGEGSSVYKGLAIRSVCADVSERWRAYGALNNRRAVRSVERILSELRPDIVHVHNVHQHLSWATIGAAKRSGARVFYTAHDAMAVLQGKAPANGRLSLWQRLSKYGPRYNPLRSAVIRRYLRGVHVFAVSEALAGMLRHYGYLVEVLHNGIEGGAWAIAPEAVGMFKHSHHLEGKKVVLFGGRLSAAKGGECAVRALHELSRAVPEAILLVLGRRDAYAESMRSLAEHLGVGERVQFAGWLSGEDLKAAYHAADIVAVLSTYLDPFPTVTLEAMACRKPVIGTCFGGTSEAIVDGTTGYIVDPNDIHAVAERMKELLIDEPQSRRFGEAGYVRASEEFNVERWVEAQIGAYTK